MAYITDLMVFSKVVEQQSFTAAARDLRLSVSAVSRHVTQLEETLGVQLVKRSTRKLAITDIGLDFYTRCARAIGELEQARADAFNHSTELKGQLRIRSTIGIGHKLILPAINEFLKRYRDMSVELTIGVSPVNLIERGLDVIIRSDNVPDVKLSSRELGAMRYVICAAPDFVAAFGRPKTPDDLKTLNCILHSGQAEPNRWRIRHKGRDYNPRVRGTLLVNNGVALYDAVKAGVGIGRLPIYAVGEDIKAGTLEPLFRNVVGSKRSIKAFYLRSRQQPAKLKLFLDFLEQHLRAHPI
jgi:DNA-binding transcriptional LysR family regulator